MYLLEVGTTESRKSGCYETLQSLLSVFGQDGKSLIAANKLLVHLCVLTNGW